VTLTTVRGGTNLRVGFIELHRSASSTSTSNGAHEHPSRVQRKLERSWPIGEILKQNKTEDLFKWIGECIAEVVQDGVKKWPGELPDPLLMGVTFSFPMMFALPPAVKIDAYLGKSTYDIRGYFDGDGQRLCYKVGPGFAETYLDGLQDFTLQFIA
jgi:hypothetical protein